MNDDRRHPVHPPASATPATTAEPTTTPAEPTTTPAEPRRWPRRVVLAAFGLSLLGNGVQWAGRDTSPTGSWRDEGAKSEYRRAYEEAMTALPPVAERRVVPTSFGAAHAVRFGDADGTPILLMSGWGSGIPMWGQNLPGLLAEHTVWAVDAIGDAGFSSQDAPFRSTADEGRWIAETVSGLGLERVHLVGHSFGARLAAEVALNHGDRVETLSLLEPVQTFSTFPMDIYLWSIPSSLPFLPQSWKDASLAHIGGTEDIDRDDPQAAMIAAGTENFTSERVFPTKLEEDQLRSLTMPVYVALGGASSMHDDAAAAVETARRSLGDGTVDFWPEGTHSLPMDHVEEVNRALLDFLGSHGA